MSAVGTLISAPFTLFADTSADTGTGTGTVSVDNTSNFFSYIDVFSDDTSSGVSGTLGTGMVKRTYLN